MLKYSILESACVGSQKVAAAGSEKEQEHKREAGVAARSGVLPYMLCSPLVKSSFDCSPRLFIVIKINLHKYSCVCTDRE
jgi:hypothetical protein